MPKQQETAEELPQESAPAESSITASGDTPPIESSLGVTELELAEALALIRKTKAMQGIVVSVGLDGKMVSSRPGAVAETPLWCDFCGEPTPRMHGSMYCQRCQEELRAKDGLPKQKMAAPTPSAVLVGIQHEQAMRDPTYASAQLGYQAQAIDYRPPVSNNTHMKPPVQG